jgi:hypothetical protein
MRNKRLVDKNDFGRKKHLLYQEKISGKHRYQECMMFQVFFYLMVLTASRKQAPLAADHIGLNASLPQPHAIQQRQHIANSWDEELAEQLGKYLGEVGYAETLELYLDRA